MITKNTFYLKGSLFLLELVVLLTTPLWLLMIAHYIFIPMPILFDSPSLVPTTKYPLLTFLSQIDLMVTLRNVFLMSLFFLQHIVMATLKFKILNKEIWKKFPFY